MPGLLLWPTLSRAAAMASGSLPADVAAAGRCGAWVIGARGRPTVHPLAELVTSSPGGRKCLRRGD